MNKRIKLKDGKFKLPGIHPFLMLFVFPIHLFTANFHQAIFENVTSRDGISQSTVNNILQDKNGFLWFATYDGLNKYDGYTYKVYRRDKNEKSALSSNGVISLYEDKNGYLFIGNNTTGLDIFDPRTEEFVNFKNDLKDQESIGGNTVFYINQDSHNNIWVCAGNTLNLFTYTEPNIAVSGKFKQYINPNSPENISYLFEDSQGNLLVFSDSLLIFDITQDSLINTGVPLYKTLTTSVIEYTAGNILIGTNQAGILKVVYDRESNVYRRADPGKINVTPENRCFLFQDHTHHLWIATELEGIYRFDLTTEKMDHYVSNKLDQRSISDNTIYSLYKDKSGILWIGTFSMGLCKYDFNRKPFLHFKNIPYEKNSLSGDVITSIHGIDPDELWVGLDIGGGVNRVIFSDDREPRIIRYQHDPLDSNSLGNSSALCLAQRRNREIWIGGAGIEVTRMRPEPAFSGKKPEFKRYYLNEWTFSIFEDSDGVLWGGTWGDGLWRYNDRSDSFDHFIKNAENQNSLGDDVVWSIAEDSHKNIWIGGHSEGIWILTADEKKKSSPRFIHIELDTLKKGSQIVNTIHSLCRAEDGTMWVGTAEGLKKLINPDDITGYFDNFPKLVFESFYLDDGLPSETIMGIVEDNSGNIWLSTVNGISKLDLKTNEFTNYNENHGLQSNEFWHNAYFKNADGMLFFGGKNGFNAFNPKEIKVNPFLPNVVITELKLFNKTVLLGDEFNDQKVLDKPIHLTKELMLNHKNNIITFEFVALHYAQPNLIKYAYYLEGFEDTWNYIDNQRMATYTNLDPGNYTFRVKATNNDAVWSEKQVALKIIIKPPWWNSLLVKLLAPVLLILLILFIFRIRVKILKDQKKKLEQLVGQRTEELREMNTTLEERQEEILLQNDELMDHRNNLEELVKERTLELETAKRKAEESDRLKSSFLANMSHEIRTPMNAIIGFSNLLDEEDLTEEEKDYFVQTIQSNGETLLVLINDILDISTIEANQLKLSPKYFDVNSILLELENYCQLNNKNNLKITFENKNSEGLILHLDPVRFRQIMTNLLSNALKYTNEGFVKFGYTRQKNEILFFVSDSGIGIDPQYQKNIFDHFYKIELQANTLHRGTGIGLAICKKLVELLHGEIYVESQPGTGTSFYFTIPYKDTKDAMVNNEGVNKTDPDFNLDRIFLVIAEDEPTNYQLMVKMLHINSHRHFWGDNGKDVVDFISNMDSHENVLVLMDIKMPIMDGHEALKRIRKINPKIPVVAVTAYAMKVEETDFFTEGFDAYISKPINKNNLKQVIASFFKR